ncbi:MAG: DUF4058 family protein [Fimbriiglobus sp.]
MPLLDHFRPPVSDRKSWEGVHAMWCGTIVQHLNDRILSSRFECEQHIHRGPAVEIDVAGYEDLSAASEWSGNGNSGGGVAVAVAPQTYAPPAPSISAEASFAEVDGFEVRVYKPGGGWKLVAAIELLSPGNKDRGSARRAFSRKCGAYLQAGVSVVMVDVVTDRAANMHDDLTEHLNLPAAFDWSSSTGLAAVSYRAVTVPVPPPAGTVRLDVWPHSLTVGQPLPTVPLWLAPGLAVPLDLEPTYQAMCRSLRLG